LRAIVKAFEAMEPRAQWAAVRWLSNRYLRSDQPPSAAARVDFDDPLMEGVATMVKPKA
jgi:hypothetical protein